MFAGLFPVNTEDYEKFRDALAKLRLNDSALHYEPEVSVALGFGFRCGFLGLLHMDIVQERLEREYELTLVTSAPTVVYEVLRSDGKIEYVDNPAKLPAVNDIEEIREPIISANILVPPEHVGAVLKLCNDKRGTQKKMLYLGNQVSLQYELPLAEVVLDFFDRLKSSSRGYASFDYEFSHFSAAPLVKLDILINGDPVDALSIIVHRESAYQHGRELVDKMQELIPRQMFEVAVQAAIGTRRHRARLGQGAAQERARQVLRRGREPQAQAAGEAEGRQEAHEAVRSRGDSAGGLPCGAAGRSQTLERRMLQSLMPLIVVLSWLALPVTLICIVDDWFLRPRRALAAAPGTQVVRDPPLMTLLYTALPVLIIAAVVRLLGIRDARFQRRAARDHGDHRGWCGRSMHGCCRPRRVAAARAAGRDPALVAEPGTVDYARSFFPVALVVLLLRSFIFEPFRIPSDSMMPTLLDGDFIIVNKYAYGLRLPVINRKVVDIGEPKRGDVVVFRFPPNPSVNFIKRLVGLPGDHVEVRDNHLYHQRPAGAGGARRAALQRWLLPELRTRARALRHARASGDVLSGSDRPPAGAARLQSPRRARLRLRRRGRPGQRRVYPLSTGSYRPGIT